MTTVNECVCAHSVIPDSEILWTTACQAPSSTGFSRQECWSGFFTTSATEEARQRTSRRQQTGEKRGGMYKRSTHPGRSTCTLCLPLPLPPPTEKSLQVLRDLAPLSHLSHLASIFLSTPHVQVTAASFFT